MTSVEVTLIIIGIIFVFVSFFVQEKLSQKDIEEITKLSEKELKVIVERQLKSANDKVTEAIGQAIDEAQEQTKRDMEKETNEKIMAISEYSNTVLDSMNKTHNEILFLYNMLNDKHSDLTQLASQLQQFSDRMRSTQTEVLQNIAEAAKELEQPASVRKAPVQREPATVPASNEKVQNEEDSVNHNNRILILHQQGMSDVEIARQLGLGLGEVMLVIGLYRGEEAGEV